MKIAIVGSGVSGLVAAHLLHPAHEVRVFEANDYAGGHTHTVEIREEDRLLQVDTGFIVFNPVHYPNFSRLLERLGVESQKSDMSFSVRCDRTGLEYNGTSLNRVFAQRRNVFRPRFWMFLKDILRFNREAPGLLEDEPDDSITVERYVRERGYGRDFYEYYLVPLGASLWSCPPHRFRLFPIRFVVDFLRNHCMLQVEGRPPWRVVRGGSRKYVEALTKPFSNQIYLKCPVRRVRRKPGQVVLTHSAGTERFDEVVLAVHADQALRLLESPETDEKELLSAFPYQENDAVLHTDTSLLPRNRRAWASWNYRIPGAPSDQVTVTYNMNLLQTLQSDRVFCVSLNQYDRVHPSRVIRRIPYEHPVYTPNRYSAQSRHGEMIRRRGVSYCGAYWGYGFHEDGVNSALRVCSAFGRSL